MASGECNIGIGDHSSTKVMAPPGGKTSINLFGSDDPAPMTRVRSGQSRRNESHVFEGGDLQLGHKGGVQSCQAARQKSSVFTAASEPIPTRSQTPQRNSGDIIRSKSTEEPPKPSIHVVNPPGGQSHITFG